MTSVMINCPACSAEGRIPSLDQDCDFCKTKQKVPLTRYLRIIGHTEEAKNVEHYQKHVKHRSKSGSTGKDN
jgi:hypothetical protein